MERMIEILIAIVSLIIISPILLLFSLLIITEAGADEE